MRQLPVKTTLPTPTLRREHSEFSFPQKLEGGHWRGESGVCGLQPESSYFEQVTWHKLLHLWVLLFPLPES